MGSSVGASQEPSGPGLTLHGKDRAFPHYLPLVPALCWVLSLLSIGE